MSLATFLADLGTARSRFVSLLVAKDIAVSNSATIIECLAALDDFWNNASPEPEPEPEPEPDETERPATTQLVLIAPEELNLYAGTTAAEMGSHYWSDSDVLSVKVLRGSTVLTTSCTGYNGMNFEYNSLSHLCAGYRVLCNVGNKPSGIDSVDLTIQWLRGDDIVKTETRNYDWKHTPQYFTRPSGNGNYSLKINGSAAEAEVYYGSRWIDFPNGTLSSVYAGCPVRTKTTTALDAIACWSNEGADGDNFWYLT